MTPFPERLRSSPRFEELLRALGETGEARAVNVWGSFAPCLAAAVVRELARPFLWLAPDDERARSAAADLEIFLEEGGEAVLYYPETLLLPGETPDPDVVHATRHVLAALGAGGARTVVVASVAAALAGAPSPEALAASRFVLAPGDEADPERLLERLASTGFDPVPAVEYRGEASRRGGILDLFPHEAEEPFRIEFDGDRVASIRTFDVGTQRSHATVPILSVHLEPPAGARESDLFDHLPEGTLVFLQEPEEIQASFAGLARGPRRTDFASLLATLSPHARISVSEFGVAGPGAISFDTGAPAHFGGDLAAALAGLSRIAGEIQELVVFCGTRARAERMDRLLADENFPAAERVRMVPGRIARGFVWKPGNLAAIGWHELFGKPPRPAPRRMGHFRSAAAIDDFLHLANGDFVVHLMHGIGRYRGLERIEKDERLQEFMRIEYRGGSILAVPMTQTDLVHKYAGAGGHVPSLDRLGGKSWAGKVAKVSESLRGMAGELLEVQAVREAAPGHAYPPDDWLQRQFEASFEFEDTEDQVKVAEEVKGDLAKPRPSDRLICGDVGYGKTEIAVRAAFKVVSSSRQVAVLVPTTILAEQHYRTFSRRLDGYPVRIDCLSRFRTRREQNEILERLAFGETEIVIGTHRLLQRDVSFHDLGLLVVDEEQRFGVADKERLKRMKKTVDCLTLSATPIPRTLHMALLGLRDISNLATPPSGRLAVATHVARWDDDLVRRAIEHELDRGGQVYFVHNRIYDVRAIAARLADLVPRARLGIAHGRMDERELERVVYRFVEGETDLLVSTSIIENGLDIPNVNTILIHRAERFGLSDLHQLRGRVGRHDRQAYCYLLVPETGALTPEGKKRLKAIQDHQELGSGFAIAMRDLEIRGAGNILGAEQHGHIVTVGYDVYGRLLRRTVAELKGETTDDLGLEPGPMVDLAVDAHVPEPYVPDIQHRISLYRRLSSLEKEEDAAGLAREIADRYGPLPPPVENLLDIARLKARAAGFGVTLVKEVPGRLIVQAHDLEDSEPFLTATGLSIRLIDPQTVHLILPAGDPGPRGALEHLVRRSGEPALGVRA
ncbi:MAG: transcription-repair coupling factor [Planctomycetes bacterium]|nr:transcription-repair coupling factor [Planctomycetota bacterium]